MVSTDLIYMEQSGTYGVQFRVLSEYNDAYGVEQYGQTFPNI